VRVTHLDTSSAMLGMSRPKACAEQILNFAAAHDRDCVPRIAVSRRSLSPGPFGKWSGITGCLCMATKQTILFSARARIQCVPQQMTPSQPSMTSVSA
jgi:hypothetical protein